MENNGLYQYDIIKKLYFNRQGGSVDELRAANVLKTEIEALGGTAVLEPFEITHYEVKTAKLTILEPFEREITVTGIGRTGSTPADGITASFKYIENGEDMDFYDVKGKIVMINSIGLDVYKRLIKSGALGFLAFDGNCMDDIEKTDLGKRCVRDLFIEQGEGTIPGLNMRVKDAIEMVRDGASKVKIELQQTEFKLTSHNVSAEIKGSDFSDEIVAFTAHYDSVPFSLGAWDNASGSADLMELYRYYKEEQNPRRTLKFIWCGSEELGLLGSKAYTLSHKEDMEKYHFCINIDMTGTVLGNDIACYTADNSLQSAMEYLAREMRHSIKISQGVYSSDSTPFADSGVPAVSFARQGQAMIHNRNDLIMPLCPQAMAKTIKYIKAFTDRIINAEIMPVPRQIPQNMKDEIDKYYRRELKNK